MSKHLSTWDATSAARVGAYVAGDHKLGSDGKIWELQSDAKNRNLGTAITAAVRDALTGMVYGDYVTISGGNGWYYDGAGWVSTGVATVDSVPPKADIDPVLITGAWRKKVQDQSQNVAEISQFGDLGTSTLDTRALQLAFASTAGLIDLEGLTLTIDAGVVEVTDIVKQFRNGIIERAGGAQTYLVRAINSILGFEDVVMDGKSAQHTGLWMEGGTLLGTNFTVDNIGDGTNSAYGIRLEGVTYFLQNPKAKNYSADQVGRFILQTTTTANPDSHGMIIGGHMEEIASTGVVDSDGIGLEALGTGNPPVLTVNGLSIKNCQKRYFKANTGVLKLYNVIGTNDKYEMRGCVGLHQKADYSTVDSCDFRNSGTGNCDTMIKLAAPTAIGANTGTKIVNSTCLHEGALKGLEAVIEMDGEVKDLYVSGNTASGFKNLANGISSDVADIHEDIRIVNNKTTDVTGNLVQFRNVKNAQVTGNTADLLSNKAELTITGERTGSVVVDNPLITTGRRPDNVGTVASGAANSFNIDHDGYIRIYDDDGAEFYGQVKTGALTQIDATNITMGAGVLDGTAPLATDIGVSFTAGRFYIQHTGAGFIHLDVSVRKRRIK